MSGAVISCLNGGLKSVLRVAVLAVMTLGLPTESRSADNGMPGVFGTDDRSVIDSSEFPWRAVGHINISGFRESQFCTGTLIAPDLVVTAAHCLLNRRTGTFHPARKIHFVAGVRRDRSFGHSTGLCVSSLVTVFYPRRRVPVRLAEDLALVRLQNPIEDARPVSLDSDTDLEGRRVVHAGYPRDRRFLLSAHRGCRILTERGGLFSSSCDTNFGASGGPVFRGEGEDTALAGVMVGVKSGEFSIGIPVEAWRHLSGGDVCHPE